MKRPQIVDLNESIRRTAELAQTQVSANRVALDLKLSSRSPLVLAHPAELSQALLTLVTNAIDAISSFGSPGTVRITSAVIRNHVLVSVVDDAPSAKPAERPRLSLSRDIIREIGGDLWMSHGEPHETTFTIDLPSASLN